MSNGKLMCRICGDSLSGTNIGYVSRSKGYAVSECKDCHIKESPRAPKPAFKSWQIFGRRLHQ